jgi:hypothetical protein
MNSIRRRAPGTRTKVAVLISVLLISLNPCVAATITDEALQKSIEEAKILGSGYSVSAATAGKVVTLSTYTNLQSKDPDNDCKIDAVLLAKKAFDLNPDLTRVRVLFYNFDRQSYREINVTTGDVLAFGSGQLSKDKLLDSLELKVVAEPKAQKPPTETKGSKENKPKTETKESSATKETKKDTNYLGCQVGEMAFYYPKNWALKKNVRQDSKDEPKLAILVCTNSKDDAEITLRMHAEDTPAQQQDDDERYWKTHNYRLGSAAAIKNFGYGGKFKAIDETVMSREYDKVEAERHLYFFTPTRKVYSFELDCNKDQYSILSRDLDYMLNTVTFPSRPTAPPHK